MAQSLNRRGDAAFQDLSKMTAKDALKTAKRVVGANVGKKFDFKFPSAAALDDFKKWYGQQSVEVRGHGNIHYGC